MRDEHGTYDDHVREWQAWWSEFYRLLHQSGIDPYTAQFLILVQWLRMQPSIAHAQRLGPVAVTQHRNGPIS